MESESVIIPCPRCGTKNRIPRHRLRERPICGRCRSPLTVGSLFPDAPVEVTDQSFDQEITRFSGPVVLDCWAAWCGPCRTVAPVIDQLAKEYAGRVKFAKLNVDQNPGTAGRFAVQSIPTLLFFKAGKLIHSQVGALPKREIERQIQNFF
jgi:thioredoxin 2